MKKEVRNFANDFLKFSKGKPIRLISHYDTDGITSAAILSKTFCRMDKKFSVRIVKGITQEILDEELNRNKNEVIFFSDLGSSSLDRFKELDYPVFIIDHHEIDKGRLNKNCRIINPHLSDRFEDNNCCSAGLCYLFSRELSDSNSDLSKLAVIGMIGDRHETNLSKISQQIINETNELVIKKGVIIYPATRPLSRALEWSTSPYIPGVSGNREGALELLKECKIEAEKSLLELTEMEMSRLITGILIRKIKKNDEKNIIGNLFILKFFNTKEDAREISILINACSRLGYSDIALSYCLENKKAKLIAKDIYSEYKQELINGLRKIEKIQKISGKGFVILNAKDEIKDAIIGTICSMLSSSPEYKEGTILIGMAYNEDKIKVSARIVGRSNGKNLKEFLDRTALSFKNKNPDSVIEVGGHQHAAGCLIEKDKEKDFLEILQKNLEVEIIKVN